MLHQCIVQVRHQNIRMLQTCSRISAALSSSVRLAGGSVEAGDVPLSSIQTQIQVLNSAFAGSPFTFVLAGVDRHTNASVRHPILLGLSASPSMRPAAPAPLCLSR